MLLTAGERALLHLLIFWNVRDPPDAITQAGIGAATRLRRSHVPRTMKALIREGYLEEREGRVRGRGRRVRIYYLTESGLRRARELAKALDGQPIITDGGPTTLGEFAKASDHSLLEVALDVDESGRYRGGAREAGLPAFLGRGDELAALSSWLPRGGASMVIYGGTGIGKTALARRFLQRSSRTFWWRDLQAGDSGRTLLHDLAGFLGEHGLERSANAIHHGEDPWEALPIDLDGADLLLVFDNYGDVPEDVVDFFSHLARVLQGAPTVKLLVLAQESTPSYCRFYDRRAVEGGRVEEIHIRGLTLEESRELLGNPEIADEAIRRIYQLTKGCPLYLELIRAGDAKTLKARSRFTTAEVSLLMFSRDVVS